MNAKNFGNYDIKEENFYNLHTVFTFIELDILNWRCCKAFFEESFMLNLSTAATENNSKKVSKIDSEQSNFRTLVTQQHLTIVVDMKLISVFQKFLVVGHTGEVFSSELRTI